MNAKQLAESLQRLGVPARAVLEPTVKLDGQVDISDTVHVQVPYLGNAPNVVMDDGVDFIFGEPRPALKRLVQDIHAALRGELVEGD